MPFTLSHPAAVLPFHRLTRWFSFSALVIGSMVPDFEYFFRMESVSLYSHTLEGLFWFDIPLGIVVLLLYQTIIKIPLLESLPYVIRCRVKMISASEWLRYFKNHFVVVTYSIAVGAATHIFWDNFTHPLGYFVMQISFLQQNVSLYFFDYPLYRVIQHLSTIVGAVFIALAILKLPVNEVPRRLPYNYFWTRVAVVTVLFLALRYITFPVDWYYKQFLISCISASLVGLVVASIAQCIHGTAG